MRIYYHKLISYYCLLYLIHFGIFCFHFHLFQDISYYLFPFLFLVWLIHCSRGHCLIYTWIFHFFFFFFFISSFTSFIISIIFLLILCLDDFSVVESGMLKFIIIALLFFPSDLWFFYYIQVLLYWVHILTVLTHFIKLTLLPLHNGLFCLMLELLTSSLFSLIQVTPTSFWFPFPFAWIIFIHNFIFSLWVSLKPKWVSYKQHIVRS